MTSNTEIVWETPPARQGRTGGVWIKRLQPLIENPGAWARVYEGTLGTARSTSGALRADKYTMPEVDGKFVFKSSKVDDEVGRIYAIYLAPGMTLDDEADDDDDTEPAEKSEPTTSEAISALEDAVFGDDDDDDDDSDDSSDEDWDTDSGL